uniref:Uncharacterized protein n=1 Tax=Cacopsylla melanoneura TaxID=428564 RepID=A0A8D8WN34_9HEMI
MTKNKMINLEDRRYILDASFLSKIINNIIDCPQLLEKIQFRINNRSTRNLDTFKVPFARTNMFANSPIIRIQKIGNDLNSKGFDIFHDDVHLIKKQLHAFFLNNQNNFKSF